MKTEDEKKLTQITQWIDGELDDEQVRHLLDAQPELIELKQSADETGKLLRQELPQEENLPYPDFFNHRIQQRLLEEDSPAAEPAAINMREEAHFFPLFTRSRLFAGLAFGALAIGLIVHSVFGPANSATQSEIVGTYTPNPNVEASIQYNAEAQATIIVLEGLDAIPSDVEISGIFPSSYQPDAALATTTLRDKHNNQALVILENDHYGRPNIRKASPNNL
ncbi:MAG: hypothetical protein L3J39_02470 [Verrucomicrobiales bacterium]|nr:hypothetical protein [Verrucomicrobiales bacterium]